MDKGNAFTLPHHTHSSQLSRPRERQGQYQAGTPPGCAMLSKDDPMGGQAFVSPGGGVDTALWLEPPPPKNPIDRPPKSCRD